MIDIVDVEMLERFYKSQIHHDNDKGKDYISISLCEKIMLLEIYKAVCLGRAAGADNNADNANNNSKD